VSSDAPQISPDATEKRQFVVVAACEDRGRCGELQLVEATSHEAAVALVAASQALTEAGVVYEVWPEAEPGSILRVTLKPPRPPQHSA
jgi:hypothetical protein